MTNWRTRLRRDVRGATAIEYGLIVALIAIAASGAMVVLGNEVNDMWNYVSNSALSVL